MNEESWESQLSKSSGVSISLRRNSENKTERFTILPIIFNLLASVFTNGYKYYLARMHKVINLLRVGRFLCHRRDAITTVRENRTTDNDILLFKNIYKQYYLIHLLFFIITPNIKMRTCSIKMRTCSFLIDTRNIVIAICVIL